jgi:hypothetical protein
LSRATFIVIYHLPGEIALDYFERVSDGIDLDELREVENNPTSDIVSNEWVDECVRSDKTLPLNGFLCVLPKQQGSEEGIAP